MLVVTIQYAHGHVGMTTYGLSAPTAHVYKEFGFTTDNVVAKAKAVCGFVCVCGCAFLCCLRVCVCVCACASVRVSVSVCLHRSFSACGLLQR